MKNNISDLIPLYYHKTEVISALDIATFHEIEMNLLLSIIKEKLKPEEYFIIKRFEIEEDNEPQDLWTIDVWLKMFYEELSEADPKCHFIERCFKNKKTTTAILVPVKSYEKIVRGITQNLPDDADVHWRVYDSFLKAYFCNYNHQRIRKQEREMIYKNYQTYCENVRKRKLYQALEDSGEVERMHGKSNCYRNYSSMIYHIVFGKSKYNVMKEKGLNYEDDNEYEFRKSLHSNEIDAIGQVVEIIILLLQSSFFTHQHMHWNISKFEGIKTAVKVIFPKPFYLSGDVDKIVVDEYINQEYLNNDKKL